MSEKSENLSIERCPHDRENPYAQINRDLIRDESISPACRWMIIYLLSNKDGWKISVKQIWEHTKSHHGYGRESIYKLIKEACKAGYMNKVSRKEGNLKRYKYYLSEFPKFKNSNNFSDIPDSGKPVAGSPQSGTVKKEHHISKDIFNKKDKEPEDSKKEYQLPDFQKTDNKNTEKTPQVNNENINKDGKDRLDSSLFVFNKIKMKRIEYEKLIQEFGKDIVELKLQAMDEYSKIKSKKFNEYTNHYLVLRKWINQDKVTTKKTENNNQTENSISWKGKKIIPKT